MSWVDAESQCVQEGGHLTSIRSSAENTFVTSLITGVTIMWFGFNDRSAEGNFEWSDRSNVTYENWYQRAPNNQYGAEDCGVVRINDTGAWDDYNCTSLLYFVCRKGMYN